ncbi:PREDICTED: cationic amino acid transporter 1-like [Nicotiana attenuata]|uniref:Cationic amino acid transporter 1 n=1 Tax=Nicotiana attenuata TaxID=49451 RepID=A0A1J6KDK9_NICAT|nr:PREDICTED: cationic amino acid transporter 1-like [Nicotiana attenuata]OIT28154.1 cationic amino acid transporter 1 [Nicotiana attenuata]
MGEGEEGHGSSTAGGIRRRGCTLSKDDFLPEESFKSWGNYVNALSNTPARLYDRVVTRSDEQEEMDAKARSVNQMKRSLNWWDLMWFGLGALVGAGIFVLTGLEARTDAGPAVVLAYVISGVSAMLAVFCYTEFAVEIPVAGGSFAYLRVELGDFVAFIAAGNILLEYVIGSAAMARSWTSYFATLCGRQPDDFRIVVNSLAEGYNRLDPIAIGVCIIISIIACNSTKASSRINYIASVVHVLILLFIIVAGLIHADTKNFTPFMPFGPRGVFKASAVLFFAYTGFDAVSTMAEETKNPARDIPIGLVGSVLLTTVLYCALAAVLCLMQSYKNIDVNAPFSVAFEAVGLGWGKYVVAAGALKGMTSVLLVNCVGQARYLTHISRTHMMPPWFSYVNTKSGTPANATIFMMTSSALLALFTSLDILSNLLSISTLFIFILVALALLVRRYYVTNVTTKENRNKLLVLLALIVASSIGTATIWGVTDDWKGYCVTLPIWFLATAGISILVPKARSPKVWGVPLVPWVPSASIAINFFLLASMDKDSFIRFAVWTVLLLVYYVLLGLHASYDTAKELEKNAEWGKVEGGNASSLTNAGDTKSEPSK